MPDHLTFLIGTLAIAGIPPLAGFFQGRDPGQGFEGGERQDRSVGWIGLVFTAGHDRLLHVPHVFMTFHGELPRHRGAARPPARVAAGDDRAAVGAGGLSPRSAVDRHSAPRHIPTGTWFDRFLSPVIVDIEPRHGGSHAEHHAEPPGRSSMALMALSVAVAPDRHLCPALWRQQGLADPGRRWAERFPALQPRAVEQVLGRRDLRRHGRQGAWGQGRRLLHRFDVRVIDGRSTCTARVNLTVGSSLISGFFDKGRGRPGQPDRLVLHVAELAFRVGCRPVWSRSTPGAGARGVRPGVPYIVVLV